MLGLSSTGMLKLVASQLDQIVALKANNPPEPSDSTPRGELRRFVEPNLWIANERGSINPTKLILHAQ